MWPIKFNGMMFVANTAGEAPVLRMLAQCPIVQSQAMQTTVTGDQTIGSALFEPRS